MFNTSQVILRNDGYFESGQTFVLNPPADDLLKDMPALGPALTWDFAVQQQLLRRQIGQVDFAALPSWSKKFGQGLIFKPKSQAEFSLLWQIASAHLDPGGILYLVGEKREGVANAAKRLLDQGLQLVKLDSARHCQLWRIQGAQPSSMPDLEAQYQRYPVAQAGQTLEVWSLPGVFSVGRLDEGTARLLEYLGSIPAGPVLDFGCGAGVLGAFLKLRQPQADVHMVDIHALALGSAAKTLAANQLSAKVYASDGLSNVAGKFRAIYTNPPFHAGVKTDYRVTEQMIRDAYERLEVGGEIRLIANAFLDYPERLQAIFGNCEQLAATHKFKVYRAVRQR